MSVSIEAIGSDGNPHLFHRARWMDCDLRCWLGSGEIHWFSFEGASKVCGGSVASQSLRFVPVHPCELKRGSGSLPKAKAHFWCDQKSPGSSLNFLDNFSSLHF